MTSFLLYIARSGLYLGIFYAFYLLVMRRTTFFRFNRIALLAGSALCILLPLLRVRTVDALPLAAGQMTMATVGEVTQAGVHSSTPALAESGAAAAAHFSWPTLLFCLYAAGLAVVLVTTVLSARKVFRLKKSGRQMRKDGYRTVILNGGQLSFTFGKTIYIGERDLAENPAIFTHETMHVRSRHYVDLFLFRAIQLFWWWNPLVWIARTELGLLHEYEADEGVIQKGIDATQYQLLLVRKAVGEQRFSLASGFQHAQLKNRITMMLKSSSSAWMRLSYLALIPLLAAFVYACNPAKNSKPAPADETQAVAETAATVTDEPQPSIPFDEVEVKPTFNGGDANEFAKWVYERVKYPEEAKKLSAGGRVMVQFTIDTDGSVTEANVLRGVHPLLDAEALRVVNSCDKKWTPGIQDGKPARVSFIIPIVFQVR